MAKQADAGKSVRPATVIADATALVDRIDPGDVRIGDRVEVAIADDAIVIGNRLTARSASFPRSAYAVLDRLMRWTDASTLADIACDPGDGQSLDYAQLLDVFQTLLDLGVMDSRKRDLQAVDLEVPGPSWDAFMRYLLETRTRRDAAYSVPGRVNALLGQKALVSRQPSAFYERIDAPFVALSDPLARNDAKAKSFVDTMLQRRSARRFADLPLTEPDLSCLLHFGWGMTSALDNPLGDVFVRKTSPSGGSLHPVEVYPIVMNVAGIDSGCYHYTVRRHGLEQLSHEDPREWIAAAAGDQAWVAEAAVVFACTAFLPRSAWKYQQARVGRVLLAEIGYTGQSALLTASWLGLGGFTTMALRDEIFEDRLGLDPLREPILSITGAGPLESDVASAARPRDESAPQPQSD